MVSFIIQNGFKIKTTVGVMKVGRSSRKRIIPAGLRSSRLSVG